jgi:hypothetical protein
VRPVKEARSLFVSIILPYPVIIGSRNGQKFIFSKPKVTGKKVVFVNIQCISFRLTLDDRDEMIC